MISLLCGLTSTHSSLWTWPQRRRLRWCRCVHGLQRSSLQGELVLPLCLRDVHSWVRRDKINPLLSFLLLFNYTELLELLFSVQRQYFAVFHIKRGNPFTFQISPRLLTNNMNIISRCAGPWALVIFEEPSDSLLYLR